MTTSIARQSVIIKCNIQKAFILGNYEYYYAGGLLSKFYGVEIPEEIKPEELLALLQKELPKVTPQTEQEKHLIYILKEYEPEERYDEQMKELLLWGKTENHPWQMII